MVAEVLEEVSGAQGGEMSHGVCAQQWASVVYTGEQGDIPALEIL